MKYAYATISDFLMRPDRREKNTPLELHNREKTKMRECELEGPCCSEIASMQRGRKSQNGEHRGCKKREWKGVDGCRKELQKIALSVVR